jgi:hypothetical protein
VEAHKDLVETDVLIVQVMKQKEKVRSHVGQDNYAHHGVDPV